MTEFNINAILDDMVEKISATIKSEPPEQILMIGVHTGGVWVAEQLHKKLQLAQPISTLNISFYRDDFTRIGMHPQVLPSQVTGNVEGLTIILVDDVLYTGRTIRAAINEIFDYGRPGKILLATLVERDGRELPVQADIVGVHIKLLPTQHVKLSGPTPLELSVTTNET